MNNLQGKIIGEIELKPVDQSMSEILSPGHEFESMFTANDLSYTVKVCFVDLQSVMWGINHSYSESETLIKYSEAKYSPVSPEPAGPHQTGNSILLSEFRSKGKFGVDKG